VGNLTGGSGADTFTGAGGNLSGSLSDGGGATTLNGLVQTTGSQTYNGAVTLASDVTLTGSTITFDSTVNSDGTTRNLVVNGASAFGDDVGGTQKLGNLQLNGAASMSDGISMNTTGHQEYFGALTTGDVSFSSDDGRIYAYYGANVFGGTVNASSGSATEWIDIETSGDLTIGSVDAGSVAFLWASGNLALGTVTAPTAYLYAGTMTNGNMLPTAPNFVVTNALYLYSLSGNIGDGAITLAGTTVTSDPDKGLRFTTTLPSYLYVYPAGGQAALTVDNAGDITPLVTASSGAYLNNIWECVSTGCSNLGTGAIANAASSTLSGILNAAAQDLFNSTFGTDNIRVSIQNGFLTEFGVVPPGIDAIEGDGVNVPPASVALLTDPPGTWLYDEEELKRKNLKP
jgi:hypothetical protein